MSSRSGGTAPTGSSESGSATVRAPGTRSIMSEPAGSWNGSDGRFASAARSAWIMASAVQSRTGTVSASAAARKRGGRPKMSRLEKQMSMLATASASSSISSGSPPAHDT